ncbi:MAG: MBL fold metallo-hydrolase [Phycisphaerae bacterium]|nr:MAG: MBL fold metallo-hydrolase [Planctomycetota bacterium]KAB2947674.1 MAG: MBL fold metallo-hydrolase [Phycisphaerae bacterium]MBE7455955.1 MBL fold metallo-hydrolase [Planctomycetia bacterium]MCK6464678.1 MBL fold metallo-hydrolase [Phycisphaerae bacterium]MCL4717213.1 MBL fold metallo-hydrolase [Phycisphaerae bacterium]
MLRIGDFEIHSVLNGTMRLDGGAMFGVVPKVLWQRKQDVDDLNRILLATRTLLALNRRVGAVILVDTGTGSKWPADEADRYGITPSPAAVDDRLRDLGLQAVDVTDVVVTHLHFDHNGGVTDWADAEKSHTRLHYPKARHWMHRRHWEHAHRPTLKDRASFLARDYAALEAPGTLTFVEREEDRGPCEGVSWFVSDGHTRAQLLPVFHGDGGPLVFTGDVVPTAAHLPVPWVMAYDLEPLVTMREKEAIYARCRREGLKLAFPHDPHVAGVELEPAADKPIIARTLEL